jgi:hypothetical protein
MAGIHITQFCALLGRLVWSCRVFFMYLGRLGWIIRRRSLAQLVQPFRRPWL